MYYFDLFGTGSNAVRYSEWPKCNLYACNGVTSDVPKNLIKLNFKILKNCPRTLATKINSSRYFYLQIRVLICTAGEIFSQSRKRFSGQARLVVLVLSRVHE